MRYRVAARVAATAGYFAVLTAFAHSSDDFIPEWIAFTVIFVMPLAVGFVAGLWGLVVPPAVVVLALPEGYGAGELPIWFVMLFIAFIAVPEIVIGWGARWLVGRYRRRQTGYAAKP